MPTAIKKQVLPTTTANTKKSVAKKAVAPKTTSAAKKAVAKVAEGVKAKAAAPKKSAAPKKPAVSVEKAEAPATPKQSESNFSKIEEKHELENVESLTAKVFPELEKHPEPQQVELQDLTEGISRLKGFLKGNYIALESAKYSTRIVLKFPRPLLNGKSSPQ